MHACMHAYDNITQCNATSAKVNIRYISLEGSQLTKARLDTSGTRGIFLFHFHPLGMRFHTISPPTSPPLTPPNPTLPAPLPNSHHPRTINISTSIYIHYKTHAQCSMWLWGHKAFIYSSYLFIFLSWERDVGFYPSVLIAGYYRALRASLNWPEGSPILERCPRCRAKRCVYCAFLYGEGSESCQPEWQKTEKIFVVKDTKKLKL